MMDDDRERLRREIFRPREQPNVSNASSINPDLLRLFPEKRLKRIMAKELRRFKSRQGVKWSRWLQAVSE